MEQNNETKSIKRCKLSTNIEPQIKEKFERYVRQEGYYPAQKLRLLVNEYIDSFAAKAGE